jgi:hypothetical protein
LIIWQSRPANHWTWVSLRLSLWKKPTKRARWASRGTEDLAETYLYLMRERFSTGAMIVVDGEALWPKKQNG